MKIKRLLTMMLVITIVATLFTVVMVQSFAASLPDDTPSDLPTGWTWVSGRDTAAITYYSDLGTHPDSPKWNNWSLSNEGNFGNYIANIWHWTWDIAPSMMMWTIYEDKLVPENSVICEFTFTGTGVRYYNVPMTSWLAPLKIDVVDKKGTVVNSQSFPSSWYSYPVSPKAVEGLPYGTYTVKLIAIDIHASGSYNIDEPNKYYDGLVMVQGFAFDSRKAEPKPPQWNHVSFNDPTISYTSSGSNSWVDWNNGHVCMFIMNPLDNNATVKFTFNGTGIKYLSYENSGFSANNAGLINNGIFEVYIDDAQVTDGSRSGGAPDGINGPVTLFETADNALSSGMHTIKIVFLTPTGEGQNTSYGGRAYCAGFDYYDPGIPSYDPILTPGTAEQATDVFTTDKGQVPANTKSIIAFNTVSNLNDGIVYTYGVHVYDANGNWVECKSDTIDLSTGGGQFGIRVYGPALVPGTYWVKAFVNDGNTTFEDDPGIKVIIS